MADRIKAGLPGDPERRKGWRKRECRRRHQSRKAKRWRGTGKDDASPKGATRKTAEDILRPCYLPLERQSQDPRPDQFLPRHRAES